MTCTRIPSFLSLLVGLLLLAGCGGSDSGPASDLGDWTLHEEGLSLTEDLLVSETDSFYFGSIAGRDLGTPGPGLDVLSTGRIVVADAKAKNLKILRPDGTLAQTLGHSGQGPGEFQRIASVQVARGDSIYAYESRRFTVFAPASPHEVVRTEALESGRLPSFRMLVTEIGLTALYGTPMIAGRSLDSLPRAPWRRVDETGTPGDTLFTVRLRRMASVQIGDEARFRMYPMPFERSMPVALGPDGRLYVGHTDSLHVSAYRRDGTSEVVASVPNASVPVQEADRDSALAGIGSGELRSKITSALPETKPVLTDLVVADDGRLWVQRPAEGPNAETVPWWVLDPEAKTIRVARLPEDVDLEVVRNGMVYGTTETEMGAPAVVRYRIDSSS